ARVRLAQLGRALGDPLLEPRRGALDLVEQLRIDDRDRGEARELREDRLVARAELAVDLVLDDDAAHRAAVAARERAHETAGARGRLRERRAADDELAHAGARLLFRRRRGREERRLGASDLGTGERAPRA